MKQYVLAFMIGVICGSQLAAQTLVHEVTSPYHHITVVDRGRLRTLHFDNTHQSQISLDDPLKGHYEYTEYFHMPFLWNHDINDVLLIGLGGSSIQRAFQAHWPKVTTETVELDPKVIEIAKTYFEFKETDRMKAILGDGRQHLRRSQKKYDLIILDAYTANRYGAYVPYPLVTREFFELAKEHLTDNGLLAYNVIGDITNNQKNVIGSIYKTLKAVFPQVYLFPAESSFNVVMVASQSDTRTTKPQLRQTLEQWTQETNIPFPNFMLRLTRFRNTPPPSVDRCDVMTDDFAPMDGLLRTMD